MYKNSWNTVSRWVLGGWFEVRSNEALKKFRSEEGGERGFSPLEGETSKELVAGGEVKVLLVMSWVVHISIGLLQLVASMKLASIISQLSNFLGKESIKTGAVDASLTWGFIKSSTSNGPEESGGEMLSNMARILVGNPTESAWILVLLLVIVVLSVGRANLWMHLCKWAHEGGVSPIKDSAEKSDIHRLESKVSNRGRACEIEERGQESTFKVPHRVVRGIALIPWALVGVILLQTYVMWYWSALILRHQSKPKTNLN